MTVDFKFEPGQRVVTPFGEEGFVDSCNVGLNGNKRYYVDLKEGRGAWYAEGQLTAA